MESGALQPYVEITLPTPYKEISTGYAQGEASYAQDVHRNTKQELILM